MKQIILLNSYAGPSDFIFNTECSGRRLSRGEVCEKDLVTQDQIRRHSESDYTKEWYEVAPGDTIVIEHYYDEEPKVNRKRVFRVPESGTLNPNISLDNFDATGMELEDHLLEQCELVKEEHFL